MNYSYTPDLRPHGIHRRANLLPLDSIHASRRAERTALNA